MRKLHCTVVFSLLALAGAGGLAQEAAAQARNEFTVFLRGTPIGVEEVAVTRDAQGTTITGTGRLAPPINLTVRRAEIKYDPAGRPISCFVEGSLGDRQIVVAATVADTTASSEVTQGTQTARKTDPIAADAVLLPNVFFGSYEALAARLGSAQPGAEVPVFVPGQQQFAARIGPVTEERIRTPKGTVRARRFRLTLAEPDKPIEAEVWADGDGRLVRLTLIAQGLDVVRNDIASVSSRREPVTRTGDEAVLIPANGFILAGTLSRPSPAPATPPRKPERLPAIVLVGGTGPTDRDETVGGVPVLGQLSNALADAGFLVVRYDRRGSGQSGGRAESATVEDYAEDVRAVVRFLRRRRDVDERRVAVLGYGEGGLFSMLAASRDDDIRALVLAATPGTKGTELVMEQQRAALGKMSIPEKEKQERVELQKKINEAVLTGKGWDGVPPEMRRQAESAWFRSLLAFDPVPVTNRLDQPVLIVHGALDSEIPPHHAETLAALAKLRKKPRGEATRVEIVPGVNHLLVPAKEGTVDEYSELADKSISPAVVSIITGWLKEKLPLRTR
jgi:pimeloyl-ACP methyl ester carboxylesterase